MRNKRKAFIGLMALCVLVSSGTLSYAAPTSAELEEKTSSLQNDVDTITNELDALGTELEDTSKNQDKSRRA